MIGLESALWEATRPAFRVRYIHDPTNTPRVPLYASYGFDTGPTARAKLARIVRKAPEVVVKATGRQRGGSHVKAQLDYIGRKGDVEIETRDGEILTSKDDIAERAAEWSDTLQWRSRPTVSSVSLIFSMPEGTDPDEVLGAVRALAHAELSDNQDYVLALHTDTPRPHVHLTVQAEGLDRTRFNPRPVQLNRFRERFARELGAGVRKSWRTVGKPAHGFVVELATSNGNCTGKLAGNMATLLSGDLPPAIGSKLCDALKVEIRDGITDTAAASTATIELKPIFDVLTRIAQSSDSLDNGDWFQFSRPIHPSPAMDLTFGVSAAKNLAEVPKRQTNIDRYSKNATVQYIFRKIAGEWQWFQLHKWF